MSSLCGTGDGIQGFTDATQAFPQLSYTPQPSSLFYSLPFLRWGRFCAQCVVKDVPELAGETPLCIYAMFPLSINVLMGLQVIPYFSYSE